MSNLLALANAFHAASEELKSPPPRHPMLQNLDVDPTTLMSRQISADVLRYIGDVYAGRAAQESAE